eukprot:SAG22_NODE_1044_length_5882_cov_3.015390_4_plen_243_part_00
MDVLDDFGGMDDAFGELHSSRLSASPKDLFGMSPKMNTSAGSLGMGDSSFGMNTSAGRDSMEGPAVGLPAFDLGPSMRMTSPMPMGQSYEPMPAAMDGGHGMNLMDVMGGSMPMGPLAIPGGMSPPHPALHFQKKARPESTRQPPSKTGQTKPVARTPTKRKERPGSGRQRSAAMLDDEKKVSKRPWSKEEDDKVLELVEIHGAKNWPVIAGHLEGRVGKQCRERWVDRAALPGSLQPSASS